MITRKKYIKRSLILSAAFVAVNFLYVKPLFAEEERKSIDQVRTGGEPNSLSYKDYRSRFEVVTQLFILDSSGTRLLNRGTETRLLKFGSSGDIIGIQGFQNDDKKLQFAIRHRWTMSEDKRLKVHIEQFKSMISKEREDVKFGDLVKESTIDLKDFSQISWVLFEGEHRYIFRMTPQLSEANDKTLNIQAFPISLSNVVVYDSENQVWAKNVNYEGKYLVLKTSRGRFILSYYPFKGSSEMGYAKGDEINLNVENPKLNVTFKGSKPIISTKEPVLIYGMFNNKKIRTHSIGIGGADTEEGSLKDFAQ